MAVGINTRIRTGGHILIEQLALHGADTAFGVPGESFLAALDGMYQSQRVRFINARQEGGAAMMAEAYGKMTGRPGIVFATRGPGATNASFGVHVAFQDSTPMILLHRPGRARHDGARSVPGDRLSADVRADGQMGRRRSTMRRRIPEFISRAFFTATSGRPGPVVLALPEDMLTDTAEVPDAPPYNPLPIAPDAHGLRTIPCAAVGSEKAVPDRRRRRLERYRAPRSRGVRIERTKCRSASRSAARTISTICIPAMAAMSASVSTPRSPTGSATAIW